MSKGVRLGIVLQSQLMWAEGIDPPWFVETGQLGESAEEGVLPFDPDLRSQIVKQFQGA